jgi:transposase
MRQLHLAGEKLFIDYCGPTVSIVNPDTGEYRYAQIFVATMGASNFTYVEASESQKQESWLKAHVNALQFLGGIPHNLKRALKKVVLQLSSNTCPYLTKNSFGHRSA